MYKNWEQDNFIMYTVNCLEIKHFSYIGLREEAKILNGLDNVLMELLVFLCQKFKKDRREHMFETGPKTRTKQNK